MNITFLVGNGFDMRMGLNTSYKEVEAYYTNRNKESSSIKDFQTHIQENGEYWSNFEMGLGKYTGNITEGQSEYLDCVNDFTNELIRYLTAEESKVFLEGCEADIKKVFEFSISHFDVDVPAKYKSIIKRIMSGNEDIVFRFASFNYTHILDECLKISFGKEKKVGEHVYSGNRRQHVVDTNVLHIHGELPGPIITGVDNRDQIDNTQWADDYRFREILVKPALNSRAGKMVDDELKRIIQESKIICIFGMSIGESDKSWWELVGQWLNNENHRLLIFEHQDMQNRGKLTYPQQFAIENEKIDWFLKMASIPNEKAQEISQRINVVINPRLFNINLVELAKERRETAEAIKQAQERLAVAELNQAYQTAQREYAMSVPEES